MSTKNSPYTVTQLPHGPRVALHPMPQVASVAVGLWVKAGGRYESAQISGVSHFLEHLLFKGTRTKSCEQLKQAIEGVGGSLNGFTAEEFTCYMAKVPARFVGRAVGVLSDMLLHPRMAPRDIEKEREVILEEIRMYEDAPGQYIHDLFNQLLWPNHPLGNILSGTIGTVKKLNRRDLVAHWKRLYHPRNCLVSCAGSFDANRLLTQLRHVFRHRQDGRSHTFVAAPRHQTGPRVRLMHKTTEQTHLCLGTPALARTHRLRFALELLHVILGANMSSRLFREVREKRSLVYEIGTHIKRYQDTGAFVIYAGCDTVKLTTTVRTVMTELGRIKRERIAARELQQAKDFYSGQLTMGLEDTMDHMLWMGEQAVTIGRVGTPQQVIKEIERVTAQQVREAARLLFRAPRMFLAVLGPVPANQTQTLRALCAI